jgi:hypothetical protein
MDLPTLSTSCVATSSSTDDGQQLTFRPPATQSQWRSHRRSSGEAPEVGEVVRRQAAAGGQHADAREGAADVENQRAD